MEYKIKGDNNPKIKSTIDDDVLKFYLNKNDLSDPDVFENFIKSVEKLVRTDERYKNYISELKSRGFNCDVFQSGINNEIFPNTAIEMHHGPMFTLYDICSIVTDHLLNDDQKVSTFKIANIVLHEHEMNNIQIVMGLTSTNHQLVHDGKMFVHIDQSIGDVLTFIKKYKKGIRREHLYTLEEYLNLCKKHKATDNDYLAITKVVKKIDKYIE
jgi:hypothetical protein